MKDVRLTLKNQKELKGETSLSSPYGFEGDGKDLPKGATAKTLQELGALQEKLQDIEGLKKVLVKNPHPLHSVLQWLLQRTWKRNYRPTTRV